MPKESMQPSAPRAALDGPWTGSAWASLFPVAQVGLILERAAGAGPWPIRHWRFVPVMQPGPRGGDLVLGDSQPEPVLRW